MSRLKKLRAPDNFNIDFCPSPKQYELWKLLQPECPLCGGSIRQRLVGHDANGNARYKPYCYGCNNIIGIGA